jgi:2-C-methyl-D-erythritol 4-phosphate cytidylyltransferase
LAVIAAGGAGLRVGGDVPKQFTEVNGKPIIWYSIDKFEKSGYVNGMVIAVPENYVDYMNGSVGRYGFRKVLAAVAGGDTRQASVFNALRYAVNTGTVWDSVLIHDAARPNVTLDDIERVFMGIGETGCAVAAVKATDTVKIIGNSGVYTPNRETVYAAQTPQGFRFGLIYSAHADAEACGFLGSDDSALTERMGVGTRLVECGYHNFKVTTREDAALMEGILNEYTG